MPDVNETRLEGRAFPLEADADMRRFFELVRGSGYDGRCSIEAYTTEFAADAARALPMLREVARGAAS